MSDEPKESGGEKPLDRKPTIVIIDDDEIVLAATADVLEQAGYRVVTRSRPSGCVAMILQEKPDLVLLDACMPTVSGDKLVKLVARASPNSNTVVLLYSALDEPLLKSKAKTSGAHGYVLKAGGPSALLRALKQWLRGSVADPPVPRSLRITPTGRTALLPQQSATRRRVDLLANREIDVRMTAPEPPRATSGAYVINTPTVLLVDDEMLVLSGYRRQLQGQPFHFDFALSGAQAMRVLMSEKRPNVVIADLMMPKPDGAEVLSMALDHDESWGRRFVIVTAQPAHDAKKRLDPRFRGTVLRKPVETEALCSAIQASLASATLSLFPRARKTQSR